MADTRGKRDSAVAQIIVLVLVLVLVLENAAVSQDGLNSRKTAQKNAQKRVQEDKRSFARLAAKRLQTVAQGRKLSALGQFNQPNRPAPKSESPVSKSIVRK